MENKTIQIVGEKKCTGCGACYNKCPVGAIEMKQNSEGFFFPFVEMKKCIQCVLCQRHCPELNIEYINGYRENEAECYAMMADDEMRKVSSSGGMFTLLADYVLDKGGYVCGAAYSDDYTRVDHIIVSDRNELWKIRGSKYVQSNINGIFRQLEEYLESGEFVLFTGCPCQVAAFRSYLNKDYNHLLLADIICHGTPSPKVYQQYINELSNGRKIKRVDFREKDYWGWGTATSVFFENGSIYRGDCFTDKYLKAFLGGVSTRQSCGTCRYANPNRVGDFTIGDFWGVDIIDDSGNDKIGTSLIFVNNHKAESVLKKIKNKCKYLKKINMENVLELAKTRNGWLLHPTKNHWARKRFFELLDNKTMSESYDCAVNSKYDVGITGWWYNENYGGTLTYYALHQVLKKMGLSVLMIAKCSWDKNYQPKYDTVPYRFAMKNYYISKNYTPENISILNSHCKTFISGSDQLFNPTLWEYSGPQYFLNYVSAENNIISYASSFGNGFVDNKNLKVDMAYWLNRFNAISVREDYGKDICKDVFNLDAEKVMDPVFLCDVEEYKKQADKSGKVKDHNYLLNFILDPSAEKRQAILNISEKLNLPYINLLNAMDFEKNIKALNLDNTKANIDIEEWLFYYINADFIITDSFHGTCFAIIFRKNFISLANYQRGEKRFVSLLSEVGLMDRLVYDIAEIEKRPELFRDINYEKVYENMTPKIQASYQWLENAIKHPKSKELNMYNILNCEIERLKQKIEKLIK